MTLAGQQKPASLKTPLVRKKTADRTSSVTATGILFIFNDVDNQVSAYVSKDPVFDCVEGFQYSTSFLTPEMIEFMRGELVKRRPEDAQCFSSTAGKMDAEALGNLLYAFADGFMVECQGGEVAAATVLVNLLF